jgi:transposase-like protein
MLNCPTCRNPMRIRTIEVLHVCERIRLACDSCRREAIQELNKSTNKNPLLVEEPRTAI